MIQSGDFFELQSQLILAVIEVSVLKTFHRNKSEEAKHTGTGTIMMELESCVSNAKIRYLEDPPQWRLE